MKKPFSENSIIEGEILGRESSAPSKKKKTNKTRSSQKAGKTPLSDDPSHDAIVTKSNSLIQKTKYALPKLEQKILLAMISQINPRLPADPDKVYSLSFADFSRLANVNMNDTTYLNYLKATIKSLEDRSFWSLDPDGDGYTIISWLQRGSKVKVKEKAIKIKFSPDILPYLTQLKSNYTSYNVEYLLTMNSTYSMRFYEIMLSYDNGSVDYGYSNGLIFQPVNEDILTKFPDKAEDIRGFKYKVFDIQELKEQLSPPPDKDKRTKGEKTLAEKYPNYSDFERYVLVKAKREINETTDLWFDYAPVKLKGYRRFTLLYIFIKYKSDEEMQSVREIHAEKKLRPEESTKRTKRSSKKTPTADKNKTRSSSPGQVSFDDVIQDTTIPNNTTTNPADVKDKLPANITNYSKTEALNTLAKIANIKEVADKINPDLINIISSVFAYLALLLTDKKTSAQASRAIETENALNRLLERDHGLQNWSIGMAKTLQMKFVKGETKSPQYYATVIFNMIDDFTVYETGVEELRTYQQSRNLFMSSLNSFDD